MQVNVTHPSQLNEPGPRSEGSLRREDERSRSKRNLGRCNGTRLVVVARGAQQKLQALRSTLTNYSRRNNHVAYLRFF